MKLILFFDSILILICFLIIYKGLILDIMALELILIVGGSAIGFITLSKPVVGILFNIQITEYIRYKYLKKHIRKQLYKSIEELDYDSFVDGFDKLKTLDSNNDSQKYSEYKKKFCVNNDIINDRKLFKIRFDPSYLVEQCSSLSSSSEELFLKEQSLIQREQSINKYEGIDALRSKEEELKLKEQSLKEKEDDFRELLKNYTLLQI